MGASKLSLALSIFLLALHANAEVCGQLAGVKGPNVEILRRQSRTDETVRFGMKIEEKKTSPVECDDVVLTGPDSSALLILANAKLTIGPVTRFEIASTLKLEAAKQPSVSLLNLTYGKLRALVSRGKESAASSTAAQKDSKSPKSGQANTFQIKTATAVAGVRGTDFFVGFDPTSGVTDQATIEGSVEVSQQGSQESVLVEGGKQVTLDATPQAALKAIPIRDSIRNDIRIVSASAREDKDFTHSKAVEILGKPATWVLEREKIPDNLKNLKEEY
ncbi:MAG: FecR family protein [Bdellovibrionota bacterium]